MLISQIKLKRLNDLNKILVTNKFQAGCRFLSDDSSKQSKTNLYETLGLPSSATPSEIKKAYYDLSFKYHPDRNKDNVEASNKFREVTEAYEILGNFGLKKRYDKGMPLPISKRTTSSPLRPAEEPHVPLQKFFDSRHSKSSDRGQAEEEEEIIKESEWVKKQKRFDEDFESSKSIRGFLTAVIIVTLFLYRHYCM